MTHFYWSFHCFYSGVCQGTLSFVLAKLKKKKVTAIFFFLSSSSLNPTAAIFCFSLFSSTQSLTRISKHLKTSFQDYSSIVYLTLLICCLNYLYEGKRPRAKKQKQKQTLACLPGKGWGREKVKNLKFTKKIITIT